MCGRYLLLSPVEALVRLFGVEERPNLQPRYNIAPTQTVPIVRRQPDGGARALVLVRWGLIPGWARDTAIGNRLINARGETVAQKPAFRSAFRARRCLVPADGFYEWQKVEGGKQPMLIRRRDRAPFAFAGLWESWRGPEGPLESCTIVTTEPNAVTAPIHNRMPVVLDGNDHEAWLSAPPPEAAELLRPCPDPWLEAIPVSTRVNSPRNDDPACIEPLA